MIANGQAPITTAAVVVTFTLDIAVSYGDLELVTYTKSGSVLLGDTGCTLPIQGNNVLSINSDKYELISSVWVEREDLPVTVTFD